MIIHQLKKVIDNYLQLWYIIRVANATDNRNDHKDLLKKFLTSKWLDDIIKKLVKLLISCW
ncbi:hypothetical protein EFQ43_09435 [Limosilactobacillus fermentum]|nr:hypothetical protein [Limosilactobacillus fermentum]